MPRNRFKRYLPTPEKLREISVLRPLGNLLYNEDLWHLNRRSAAGAAFIGLFCAFLPIPFQMVPAAVLALLFRCNLPISVALVWITNPVTMPPMFYFAYRLGAWLLGHQTSVTSVHLTWEWLGSNLVNVGYPLLFGSLVCGWVLGVTAFVVVRVTWRLHVVSRWRQRRALRKARAAVRLSKPSEPV
ncbi:MAG: DUF2062 domain-containing protein [Pseudomonadales bacterium]|nr:DUF2062 domain-containing protein [Pseudomonadales bacterium]MCP5184860.1 DUF2062 domain-containing protein [Pseudomonadales bacterium]